MCVCGGKSRDETQRSAVAQRVDRGIAIVERVGIRAIRIDVERAELTGDIGADTASLSIDSRDGLVAVAARVVG